MNEDWKLKAKIKQEIRMEKLKYKLDGKDWYSCEENKEVLK